MTIEERLENVERQLRLAKRRNRWLLGAVLLVAGGLVVPAVLETTAFRASAQGAGKSREIHATKFELEDESGKTRGQLISNKDGTSLALGDESGQVRAELLVNKVGCALRLRDQNGTLRIGVLLDKDGPCLNLYDENRTIQAGLVEGKNSPALTLFDKTGRGRAELGMVNGDPSLGLWDERINLRARLSIINDIPLLSLLDAKGMDRLLAGGIKLNTITYPESSLLLFGPDGKVIWSAIK